MRPLDIAKVNSEISQLERVNWKVTAEFFGMVAIVASLVFVGLQIRQDQSIAIVESQAGIAAASMQLAELIEGKGELWRKGLDGEELSQGEQIEFEMVAHAVTTLIRVDWQRQDKLEGFIGPNAAVRDYAFAIHSHIGLRRYFDARIKRVKHTDSVFNVPVELGGFDEATINYLDYLSTNSVSIPETKAYVFWD